RGPLASMTADLLFDGRLRSRGLFEPAAVARMWQEHRARRRDHRERLWTLVMLELWFREFVDRAAVRGRRASAPALEHAEWPETDGIAAAGVPAGVRRPSGEVGAV